MDDPFSRMYWSDYPRNSFTHLPGRYSPSVKSVPVNIQQQPTCGRASTVRSIPVNAEKHPSPWHTQTVKPEIPADAPLSKSNVVSIPVRFVDSKTSGSMCKPKSEAAITIQKTWRGYRVRKTVKKIAQINREVAEVEKNILERETVELIKRDEKERLKVNETLMALLLKLDSVRGFDEGVRNYRKAVIRRAILLQERIDSIAANQVEHCVDTTENETETPDVAPAEENKSGAMAEDEGDSSITDAPTDTRTEEVVLDESLDIRPAIDAIGSESGSIEGPIAQPVNFGFNSDAPCNAEIELSESKEVEEEQTGQIWVDEKNCFNESAKEKREDDPGQEDGTEKVTEPLLPPSRQEETSNKELLEEMAAGNEKMMLLVTDLFERNEMQTQILSNLAQRVEQLEKALANSSNKLRNKKRRKKSSEKC